MSQIVWVLILVTVLISIRGIKAPFFLEKYKFQVAAIVKGEKIRLLTAGFLHVDYLHLGFNMYALYLFSDIVVKYLGNLHFLFLYFGSLVAGNVLALWYHKNQPYYSAVGASGAVSGVVYSSILLYPNMSLYLFPIPFPIPGYLFGIGYLLYSAYGMKKQLGNIGHSAHLGGAIGGFVLTLLLYPQVFYQNKQMVFLLTIPIVLLFLFEKKLKK